jgi:hypothetical protein
MRFFSLRRSAHAFLSFAGAGIARYFGRMTPYAARYRRRSRETFNAWRLHSEPLEGRAMMALTAPSIISVTDDVGSITGMLITGGRTDDTDLLVRVSLPTTGSPAVAGDKVQLFDGANPLGALYELTATDVTTNGYADVLTGALTDGITYQINASVDDGSGLSPASTPITVTVDTTAPAAPLTPAEQGSSKLSDGYLDFVEPLTPTTFRVRLGASGAVAGDTIELLIGGVSFTTAKTIVLTAGNITAGFVDFSVTSTDLGADGVKSLTARVTDLAGNVGASSSAVAFTKDTVSPVPREIGTTKLADGNYNIADAATATTFRVYLANSAAVVGDVLRLLVNTTPIKTVTLNVAHIFDGYVDFVVTFADLGVDGAKTLSSQLTKGVTPGPNNIVISFLKDTVAPNAPLIPTEPPTPSTPTKLIDGKLNLVEYGSSTAIRISLAGTTAVAGDVVSVLLNGSAFTPAKNLTLTGTDITAGYVDFVVQAPDLGLDGLKAISAFITDTVGQAGPASVSLVFELDTSLPAAPSSPAEVGTAKFVDGWLNASEAATTTTVRVSIIGAAVNDTLELLVNGFPFSTAKIAPITAVEISQGFVLFTVSTADLGNDGLKALSTRIIDQSGNVRNSGTQPLTFTKDTSAPIAPGTPAETGNTKLSDAFANAAELAAPIVIRVSLGSSGEVVGHTVTLLLGGVGFTPAKNAVLTALDLSNGFVDFLVSASDLAADGAKSITARVTDLAGNQGAITTALTFTKDTAGPAAPNAPVEMTGKLTDGKYGTTDSQTDTIFRVGLGVSGAVVGDRVELLLNGLPFAPASSQNPVTLLPGDVTNGYVELRLTSTDLGVDGPKALSARVIDQAGNPGSPSGSLPFVKDTASPPTPFAPVEQATAKLADGILNFADAADAATVTWIRVGLSGTGAIAGDTVDLLLNGNAFTTAKSVILTPANAVDGFVDFLMTTADLGADGSKALAARLTDVNGASAVSAALTFLKDTQAPTAPARPGEAGSTKLADGKLNLIEAASQTTIRVTLSGTGAVAGDALTLRLSPLSGSWPRTVVLTGTDIANDRVDFVVSQADLGVDGFKSLSVDITDAVGNIGPASPALVFEKDTIVPMAPAVPTETGTPKVGDGYLITTEATAGMTVRVAFGQTVMANDSIELLLGGSPFSTPKTAVPSPVDISAGFIEFAVSAADLGADGSKAIAARITDQSGNVGPASLSLTFVKDTVAPIAPGTPAETGNTKLSDAFANAAELAAPIVIRVSLGSSGEVVGHTVTLLLGGVGFTPAKNAVLTALDLSNGFVDFLVSASDLAADGAKSITARVTDLAGNQGAITTALTFTKDTAGPAAPNAPVEMTGKLTDGKYGTTDSQTDTIFRVGLGVSGAVVGDRVELLLNGLPFAPASSQNPVTLLPGDVTNGYVELRLTSTDLGVDGPKALSARVIDQAGNPGSPSGSLPFVKDTASPPTPFAPVEQATAKLADGILNFADAADAATVTWIRVGLSGTGAIAGDTVDLLLNGNAFTTAKSVILTPANAVDGFVDFLMTTADLGADGSKALAARLTDVNGASAVSAALTFLKDTQAPTAPARPGEAGSTKLADGKLNLIEAASQTTIRVTLSGTGAVAGDALTLRLSPLSGSWPRTVVLTGTDIANDRVDFVVSQADLGVDGFKSLSVDITDAVGNIGPASPALVFEKDTIVPMAPAVPTETGTPKVGDGYLITTEATAGMTVRVAFGQTVMANDSIELLLGGSPFSTPKTAVPSPVDISAGFIEFAVSAADLGADGSKAIAARITDQSGNVGPASLSLTFVKDTVAPTTTGTPAERFATNLQDGILKLVEAGTSTVIRVSLGTSGAVVGDTLELLLGGASFAPAKTRLLDALNIFDTFVDFVVSATDLGADGAKSITARVTDVAGNPGTVSSALPFVKDTTAPAAPGAPAEQGSTKLVDSRLNAIEAGTATTFRVSLGSSGAIVGDTVELLLGGAVFTTPKTRVLEANDITAVFYDFTVSGTDLGADGAKSLTARLTDRNSTGPESTALAFTKDVAAPETPTVSLAVDTGSSGSDGVTNNGLVNVSGIENNATWQYSTNSGTSWTNGTGTSFTLPEGTYAIGSIRVRQTDLAGTTTVTPSQNPAAIVVDLTAPAAPTFALASDTGSSGSDGVTNNGLVNVSGIENNATWQYSTNSGTSWTNGTGTSFTLPEGTYAIGSIRVRQTDLAGTTTVTPSQSQIIVDSTAAAIANVTSTLANGTYGIGQTIPIQVVFSEPAMVTGSPILYLNTTPSRFATYSSGSGTKTLTFNYAVQLGDASADLGNASTTALVLNGGTIRDAAGNNANRTLRAPGQAGSLNSNKAIVIGGAIEASAAGLGTTATNAPSLSTAVQTIRIRFNTPVTGLALSSLRLIYNGVRVVSLSRATITGSGTSYTLTIPSAATSLKGAYRLDIGGPTSTIRSGGVLMSQTSSIFWKRV